jgi:starvation-inducible DNA-binding protein
MSASAELASSLTAVLADTYALAVKTHGAHWNVVGPSFFELHERFGEQYDSLFEAADEIAERLRAIGATAPADIRALASAATLPAAGSDHDGAALVGALLEDHRRLSRSASAAVKVAQSAGDEATADLLIGRVQAHDQTAWMLGATIGGGGKKTGRG